MMFSPKIPIDAELYRRAQERAAELGYSSVEEYVAHLLEKDLSSLTPEEETALGQRLKGLGYL